MERAAGRAVEGMRQGAGDDGQGHAGLAVEARDRAQQGLGVGMLGRVEDVVDRALLHDAAEIHDDDVARHLRDHAEVVGDEDDGGVVLGLQVAQQRQHLGLGGDVDRGGRLVGDQQARLAGKRHGDHGALAQAARELPGIGVDALFRHRDADVAEQADRDVARLAPGELARAGPAVAVQQDGLDDLVAHRVHRAEGGHRFLRDQRDLAAADVAHRRAARRQLGEVDHLAALFLAGRAAAEADLARGDASRQLDELQDRLHGHALAAAAFAHDAQHLPGHDVEAGAVDGAHQPLVEREGDFQVAHREQRGWGVGVHRFLNGYKGRRHRAARRPPG